LRTTTNRNEATQACVDYLVPNIVFDKYIAQVTGAELKVLVILARVRSEDAAYMVTSTAALMQATGLTKQTVLACTRNLVDLGIVRAVAKHAYQYCGGE
jgi:hypothetical protein